MISIEDSGNFAKGKTMSEVMDCQVVIGEIKNSRDNAPINTPHVTDSDLKELEHDIIFEDFEK
jgi:hypothetical protein